MSRLNYLVRDPISLVGFPWQTTENLVRGRVFTMLYRYMHYWTRVEPQKGTVAMRFGKDCLLFGSCFQVSKYKCTRAY